MLSLQPMYFRACRLALQAFYIMLSASSYHNMVPIGTILKPHQMELRFLQKADGKCVVLIGHALEQPCKQVAALHARTMIC